jgi:hypothetical protein
MATKFAMTVAVKTIDSQRWTCRVNVFQFNDNTSPENDGSAAL